MESVDVEMDRIQEPSALPLSFARNYQLEALEIAIKQNTIVFLETGSGKTLIAIMLLRSYAYLLRKSSPFFAVFLVPQVVLVPQQADAVKLHTDLSVGMYWGDMGVDYWDAAIWKQEIDKHEVLVMTPAILLDGLRHSYFNLSMIKVLIMDECHRATGQSPYACIMTDFYHQQLSSGKSELPRVFGMTACPINSRGGESEHSYWEKIHELETLMNSKIYTCISESELAEYVPFSTPKFKDYKHVEIPHVFYSHIEEDLKILEEKQLDSLKKLDLRESTEDSTRKRMSTVVSNLLFCLNELGVWLALKAAQVSSNNETEADIFSWVKLDVSGETIVQDFSVDAVKALTCYIPSDQEWSIGDNLKADMDKWLLTSKVVCLIESLLEYRDLEKIRCIIFVERVITAIVLQSLLSQLLPKYVNWKAKYIAGNNSKLQCQTRKKQNEILEEFHKGMVNVIVATSILEEGIDVQSCNLVIRFDPPANVCSFTQSRGRARMRNSDYLLMVKSGDHCTRCRLENYLSSGVIMRNESLHHASLPCEPLRSDLFDKEFYRVESTGAIVDLSSSISLIHNYCSRLPFDGYFKPAPRWVIEEDICTLHLPKSCPITAVHVQGDKKLLKQIACLEACKKLHKIGALTDYLVPDIVVEEAFAQELGSGSYDDEQPIYFPPELVDHCSNTIMTTYHCYLIELRQNVECDIPVHDIVLATRSELEFDIAAMDFALEVDRGLLTVKLKHLGEIQFDKEQVLRCRRFQMTLLSLLIGHSLNKLTEVLDGSHLGIDYLLLPSANIHQQPLLIDWTSITSVLFSCENAWMDHTNCSPTNGHSVVQTQNGPVCTCMLQNSLVYTPHNGYAYCVTGISDDLDANSLLRLKNGKVITYKEHYEARYGAKLCFEKQSLVKGKTFQIQNYLQYCRRKKEKEPSKESIELPPELCVIIMSPISVSTCYSFSFIPAIMHRLEALLVAVSLKRMCSDHCTQNVPIPTIKILEAITTKKCQEEFHLESLETLGDSFLKYTASQQVFKTNQNHHEGLLSIQKEKIISNAALCKLGCDRKIPGFIRNEFFDAKKWIIPGDKSGKCGLEEEFLSNTRNIYVTGRRNIKSKRVADVVEALIGAFLSTGGEMAGLLYMDWLGIKVDLSYVPYERHFQVHPERLVNVRHLESLLQYSFHDPSLLVEALTHGSYMLPEIPRSYQRLEFLGDSVLDYLITIYFYNKYPGMSPGLLTDMRSASVNNECYAHSTVKAELHKYILHASHELHKHIVATVKSFENLSLESTFGWESETSFPKVLGDVIESLAGAIYVDSGYNKEVVFKSIKPLLEPLVTPETLRLHPVNEFDKLCQKYNLRVNNIKSRKNGVVSITIEVEAYGVIHRHTSTDVDKKMAKKLASKEVLKSLKHSISMEESRSM